MRLPRVEVRASRGGPPYSATIRVELWPGVSQVIQLERLARCPDAAACTRVERAPTGRSYVVTLYSGAEPFASVYLSPISSCRPPNR